MYDDDAGIDDNDEEDDKDAAGKFNRAEKVNMTRIFRRAMLANLGISPLDGRCTTGLLRLLSEINPIGDSAMYRPKLWRFRPFFVRHIDAHFGRFGSFDL